MDKNGFYVMLSYCFGTFGILGFSLWIRYQMKRTRKFLMINNYESDPT